MNETATSEIDYTVMARTALQWLNNLEQDRTSLAKREIMSRAKWLAYGKGLLGGKSQHPSTKAFGAWVHENGLDVGVAADAQTRSDALWCAEHEADLGNPEVSIKYNNPTDIRKACRDAGYEWAFDQRPAKRAAKQAAKPEPKRKRKPKYSYINIAHEEKVLMSAKSGGSTQALSERLEREHPELAGHLNDPVYEPQLRTALRKIRAAKEPEEVLAESEGEVEKIRAEVPESKRAQFDRLVQRAIKIEINRLQARAQLEVNEEVERRIGKERAALEVRARQVDALYEESSTMMKVVETHKRYLASVDPNRKPKIGILTAAELKLLEMNLHPDRPTRSAASLNQCFAIIEQWIKPYTVAGLDQLTAEVRRGNALTRRLNKFATAKERLK